MATVKQFEDLQVWQDARTLVKDIYTASKESGFYRDIGLREQIRRAATSTMSNIAKGSIGEARSQLYVALDQEYLNQTRFNELKEMALALSRRIATFISYLENYPNNSRVRKPTKR